MKSLRGTLIVIAIILLSLVGAYLYDQAQNRATIEVIKQADIPFLDLLVYIN